MCAAVGRAHSVGYRLFRTGSRGDDESAGTHTERVDATSLYLCHERVFGRREILSLSVLVVILYLVDQVRRMFQTNAYGNSFCFHLNAGSGKIAVNIACGVTGSKNHRAAERTLYACCVTVVDSFHTDNFVAFKQQAGHLCLEMHLASAGKNRVAHILDHTRKPVCPDVGMGIGEDGGRCAMLAEDIENLVDRSAFLAARIELSVRISTGSALSEAVIRLRVYRLRFLYRGYVRFSVAYVLSTFEDYGTQPQLYEFQGGEQSGRAFTYHDDSRAVAHILVFGLHESVILWKLIDVDADFQVYIDVTVTCVNRPFQGTYTVNRTLVKSLFSGEICFYIIFVVCHLRQNT